MQVIAHRGANREALENSWDAFSRAIECGSRRIELDLQLTADNQVVINHDDSLLKTTGHQGLISRMSRAEIAKVKLKNGEDIPFLDQVLDELLPKVELNLELKGNNPKLASITGKMVAKRADADKIIISAFEAPPLMTLLDEYPTIRRACLWGRDSFTWPFIATFSPNVFLQTCQTNILHPDVRLVDRNLMDQAKARGWIVYPWVPMAGEEQNRESLWTWLQTLGVDGLCTNYPREFRAWIELNQTRMNWQQQLNHSGVLL